MRTHYRSDVNHSDSAIEIASDRVYYIYQVLDWNSIISYWITIINMIYALIIIVSNVNILQTLYDCEEVLSQYHEVAVSVPIPAEEKKLIGSHHSDFLDYMSDDLKTTDVLDGFMDLLKAVNSNLNDLKVCWCLFHMPVFQSSGIWTCASLVVPFQKLLQKLEQQKKKQTQQKKQQQKQQQQPQKQPEDHIQALIALEAEIKDKLSILGLLPPSPLAEVIKPLGLSKKII
jgi:cysteinyl-tRNA synthetase